MSTHQTLINLTDKILKLESWKQRHIDVEDERFNKVEEVLRKLITELSKDGFGFVDGEGDVWGLLSSLDGTPLQHNLKLCNLNGCGIWQPNSPNTVCQSWCRIDSQMRHEGSVKEPSYPPVHELGDRDIETVGAREPIQEIMSKAMKTCPDWNPSWSACELRPDPHLKIEYVERSEVIANLKQHIMNWDKFATSGHVRIFKGIEKYIKELEEIK